MADATRLTVVPSHMDAEMLNSALASEGLGSFVKMTDVGAGASYGLGGGSVEIWVSTTDLDHARAVLARIQN
jgi:Putative prokaryotic signal transducing protein